MKRERNAAELALWLTIGLISSPAMVGLVPLPPSLADGPAAVVSHTLVAALCIGCLLSVLGMLWADREDGEAIQQVGLVATAAGSWFYAIALIASAWPASWLAAGFCLGVGAAALSRYAQLRGWPVALIGRRLHRPGQ